MFRESKTMRELHKIREQIYREEKGMTSKQIIEKTHREVEEIKRKYNLRSNGHTEVLNMSESAFKKDWKFPREDKAWKNL